MDIKRSEQIEKLGDELARLLNGVRYQILVNGGSHELTTYKTITDAISDIQDRVLQASYIASEVDRGIL